MFVFNLTIKVLCQIDQKHQLGTYQITYQTQLKFSHLQWLDYYFSSKFWFIISILLFVC